MRKINTDLGRPIETVDFDYGTKVLRVLHLILRLKEVAKPEDITISTETSESLLDKSRAYVIAITSSEMIEVWIMRTRKNHMVTSRKLSVG